MAKAYDFTKTEAVHQVAIYCPGCKCEHAFTLKMPGFIPWTWNGNYDEPTFSPSMLVNRGTSVQCHFFVKDGKIQFLGDCFHELKNQTVELPEID